MLKQDQINRRIFRAFERHDVLKKASQEMRNYFKEIIIETYKGLESPVEKSAEYHSSSENLKFAIDVTIYDDFSMILKEFEKEGRL